MLNRLVRAANVGIASLALLMALAVYWYAIRPLPKTSGEMRAPIDGSATIKRDTRGVPHIEATSWQDTIFLQGYVTAQDRLWQMDGLRRYSAGELAEIFGPALVPADERARRMRVRAIAETDVRHLSESERAVLVEYARGVNYFIDTHKGNYSLEFSLPGHAYDPRPWSVTDSVLVGLAMFRDLTDSSKFEFAKGKLLAIADPRKARILFPPIEGEFVSVGSNAWAVSGSHTADGKPMLANDPHLAYGIPGTWHLVHLKAPGLNVSGAALPGVPCVISGHNEQIAWGVTNLSADVLDLYAEQIDNRTGRYLFRGSAEQAQLDRQTIRVRGGKPVEVSIWVTRHGPALGSDNAKTYSMRWSAMDGFGFPFFDIDRAQNWDQFRRAVGSYWGPGQNFVYADRAGNIGYQAGGRVPIRRAFDGDVPLDGASGNYEWDGYIPFEQMPSAYNPASGMIATANQNPFPPDFAYRVEGNFADKYRVEQIRALLGGKRGLTVRDMLAVQKDVYSGYDRFLAQQAIAAFGKHTSSEQMAREAVEILRRWNGQMDKDEAAPMMTELLSREIGQELVQFSATRSGSTNIPDIRPRPQVIEQLLRERPGGWVPNDDWDQWLEERFVSALQAGRRAQGSPVSQWRWGKMLQWKIEHPVGRRLPLVDRLFNIGPVEMSGSGTSVKQTTAVVGPSERMVVDLGDLDKSVQNLVAGESGFVASAHYKDQWRAYYVGNSFPMEFEHVEAKEILRVRPGK
ncbi:MAG: penicillin acylase family protein [Bryobacteraceae bacterium]